MPASASTFGSCQPGRRTATGVASADGDKAFDHEEFRAAGALPALQVIQL